MTIKLCEINEGAIILNSNMQTILKTHEKVDEFYFCLGENTTDVVVHKELYKVRELHQCNSIAKAFTNQDFAKNPIEVLTGIFNESITYHHVEQMKTYNVSFDDMYNMWIKNKKLRFGRVLGMLANT